MLSHGKPVAGCGRFQGAGLPLRESRANAGRPAHCPGCDGYSLIWQPASFEKNRFPVAVLPKTDANKDSSLPGPDHLPGYAGESAGGVMVYFAFAIALFE